MASSYEWMARSDALKFEMVVSKEVEAIRSVVVRRSAEEKIEIEIVHERKPR